MYEIPNKHSEFNIICQGSVDFALPVIPVNLKEYGIVMCVVTKEGALYITKEQAKEFFGL